MTEYTAVMMGALGVMAMLLYVTFKLSDKYDPLKIFFVGIFFVYGNAVLHLAHEIELANPGSSALENAIAIAQGVWVTITVVSLIYIGIYIIPDVWRAMKGNSKKDLYGDDN